MLKSVFTVLLVFTIVFGLPVAAYRQAKLSSLRSVTVKVNTLPDRSIQYNANGDKNDYANLVYTDKGTFQNTDSIFPYKQDSSDVYGVLHEGSTYNCDIVGWRVGLINMYPNLIRCEAAR